MSTLKVIASPDAYVVLHSSSVEVESTVQDHLLFVGRA